MDTMTQLLERAFAEASLLPEPEQDALGSIFLAELQSQQRWTQSFSSSQDELSQLADEALREFESGETLRLDLDRDFPNHETLSTALVRVTAARSEAGSGGVHRVVARPVATYEYGSHE